VGAGDERLKKGRLCDVLALKIWRFIAHTYLRLVNNRFGRWSARMKICIKG